MKVLVLSDSHGATAIVRKILAEETECNTVFFLGDGLSDIEKVKGDFAEKKFICVKGNNDFYYDENKEAYKYVDGMTIMSCHGDTYNVRRGYTDLINKVKSVMGNMALYGHTHIRNLYTDPSTGIYCINPGAACEGQYCVLDIKNGQFEYYPKEINL